jgi:hypothetical protein
MVTHAILSVLKCLEKLREMAGHESFTDFFKHKIYSQQNKEIIATINEIIRRTLGCTLLDHK